MICRGRPAEMKPAGRTWIASAPMRDRSTRLRTLALSGAVLAAVFDGHVGHTAAAFCATHLPAKLSAMLDGAFAGP